MKLTFDIFKTFPTKTRKIIWFLGLHAFSLILLIVLLELILGGFIFYKYVYLVSKQEPQLTVDITKFDAKNYQNVMEELQNREQ